jgi:hypothetical protein
MVAVLSELMHKRPSALNQDTQALPPLEAGSLQLQLYPSLHFLLMCRGEREVGEPSGTPQFLGPCLCIYICSAVHRRLG